MKDSKVTVENTSRHTPGPWKVYEGYGADSHKPIIVDSIPDSDGKCMANCICYVATTNQNYEANSRLLAAAPDLLESLIECRELIDSLGGPISMRIEMLIERVKGTVNL